MKISSGVMTVNRIRNEWIREKTHVDGFIIKSEQRWIWT